MTHVPKGKRLKFDGKSKHFLAGYSENIKCYQIYDPDTDDVTTIRNVNHENFIESKKTY